VQSAARDDRVKSGDPQGREATKPGWISIHDLVQPTITYLPLLPKEGTPQRAKRRIRNRLRAVYSRLSGGTRRSLSAETTLLSTASRATAKNETPFLP
jgi:hypothetical protein